MIQIQLIFFTTSLFSTILGLIIPLDFSVGSYSYTLVMIDIFLYTISCLDVFLHSSRSKILRKNPIKPSSIFILGFFVVFFQIPIEFIFNHDFFINTISRYVYSPTVFMTAVGFATICGISINLGLTTNFRFTEKNRISSSYGAKLFKDSYSRYDNLSLKTIIAFAVLFFALYIYFSPVDYFWGGYSYYMNVEPKAILLSNRFYGYFTKMLIISNAIFLWKSKKDGRIINSIMGFIRIYPKSLILLQFFSILLTLMIGDRGGIFIILFPLVIMYFTLKQKKISLLTFIALVFISGFFFSIIKITQIDFQALDISKNFTDATERFLSSEKMDSLSPYTLELAGSFYTYTCAWMLYLEGYSTHGLSLVMNLFMSIPYAITIIQSIFGLSVYDFNPASILTLYSGVEGYGIGTDIIGSLIIDISPFLVPFILFLFGRILRSLDEILYSTFPQNFPGLLIALIVSSNALSLARGSIYSLLGTIIFSMVFVLLISKIKHGFSS